MLVDIPPTAAALADRGQWSAAWAEVHPRFAEFVRHGSVTALVWLHEQCLRLGFDVRRRLLGRTLRHRAPELGRVRAVTVLEHVRRSRFADAFWAARQPLVGDQEPEDRRAWLLAQARVAHELRDHAAAEAALAAAAAMATDDPRLAAERAWALESADRLDDALATVGSALQRWPLHPLLRLAEAWLWHAANRPGLHRHLAAVCSELQSPLLDGLHANLAFESGDQDTACRIWSRLLAEPWHERRVRVGWRFGLLRACRERGDDDAALQHAEGAGRAGTAAAAALRQSLATGKTRPTRVVLPVAYVRQDHLTCSPATMASLLGFFGHPVAQAAIAAEITWDGTASHDELRWARRHGFTIRFFSWNAEVARELLDRGLPFALSTRFEMSGHRQAVVGYDRVLDTFVFRDPGGHFLREVEARWLDRVAARGGDCALLMPESRAAREAVPPLPDEAAMLAWLELRLDLQARRLERIAERTETLLRTTAGTLRFDIEAHTLHERGDRSAVLALWKERHDREPDDPYWQLHLATEYLAQDRWQDARAFLERVAPGSTSPFLWQLLAEQWAHDARTRPAALALLRRTLRRMGRDSRTWARHAGCLWDDEQRDEAAAAWRVAATLAPTDEWIAGARFRALRGLGRHDEGIAFLRHRAADAHRRSSAPAATLADALESLHRPAEAVQALREALAVHETPAQVDDLAKLLLRLHHHDEVAALLAEPHRFRPVDHALRSQELGRARNDRDAVRKALQAAVHAMPTHTGAQMALLDDLVAADGLPAAIATAEGLVAAQPDHPTLLVEVVDFYRRYDDHERAEALLRRLVRTHPDQLWLRGRLARFCIARGKLVEAAPMVEELCRTSPRSSAVWSDAADLAHAEGRVDDARVAAAKAVELAPDDGYALRRLLNLARNRDEAIVSLRRVLQAWLQRPQSPAADDLAGLVGVVGVLPDGEFDTFLQTLAANFPAESSIAVTRCKFLLEQHPEASLPIAEDLVRREGWNTDHHLLLARCLRRCNRRPDERTALEALLRVDPACAQAFVELGESLDQEGRLPQAVATFEHGLVAAPGYAVLHGMLADARWRLGDAEPALTAAARACELDPSYSWAFDARVRWLVELGRGEQALALTSQLVRDNPRWANAHDLHATALAALGRHDERITALRSALTLSPRLGTTRLVLLDALLEMKRIPEATAVLAEGKALLGNDPPLLLREVVLVRMQGHLHEARTRLRALLADHPDYTAGWRRLLAWLDAEHLADEILTLYRDPPAALRDEAVLYGYAADVFRRRSKRAAAQRALEQALAKDQGYGWAREQLATLHHDKGEHARVLELLPDHATPERLPWGPALLVGKALAALGRTKAAEAVLRRLMQDESARGMDVADLDATLRAKNATRQAAFLAATVAEGARDTTVVLHWLRIQARTGDWKRFWRGCDDVIAVLAPTGDSLPLVRMLVDVCRERRLPGLARWVARHLRPPITDVRLVGELMFLLSDGKADQRQLFRLLADGWRRPDVEGWMLANLSSALVEDGRLDEAEQVVTFALAEVPHDHSFWWFQRDLAEIALRRRQYAACRSAYRDTPAEHATVRLSAWQIDLCAELHLLPFWRRGPVLRSRLRRSFTLRDDALREPRATGDLRPRDLLGSCPGPLTLLLCCGAPGRWLVRRLLRT